MKRARRNRQAGSLIVEFALSFTLFWTAMIGVIEFSRFMFAWSTASEATRLAARLASICDVGAAQDAVIRGKVEGLILASGQIDLGTRTDWLQIAYLPSGCTANTCAFVEARLQDIHPSLSIPGFSSVVTLPAFRVRSPREAMRNVIKGETNVTCS